MRKSPPVLPIRNPYSFHERRLREEAFTLNDQKFRDIFRMGKNTFEKFNQEFGSLLESGMQISWFNIIQLQHHIQICMIGIAGNSPKVNVD